MDISQNTWLEEEQIDPVVVATFLAKGMRAPPRPQLVPNNEAHIPVGIPDAGSNSTSNNSGSADIREQFSWPKF